MTTPAKKRKTYEAGKFYPELYGELTGTMILEAIAPLQERIKALEQQLPGGTSKLHHEPLPEELRMQPDFSEHARRKFAGSRIVARWNNDEGCWQRVYR